MIGNNLKWYYNPYLFQDGVLHVDEAVLARVLDPPVDDELGVALRVEVGGLDCSDVTPADLLTLDWVEPREEVEAGIDPFRCRHLQVVTRQRARETAHIPETNLTAWRSCKNRKKKMELNILRIVMFIEVIKDNYLELYFGGHLGFSDFGVNTFLTLS